MSRFASIVASARAQFATTPSATGAPIALLPDAAKRYRKQIDRGLEGDPREALKARVIVNKMIAPVVIEQDADGSVWANYKLRPAALLAQATARGVDGAQERT